MKALIGTFALFMIASLSQAAEQYMVKTKIFQDGDLVGSPTIWTPPSSEASVSSEISETTLDLTLTVEPADENAVNVSTKIVLNDNELMSPSLYVELGKESNITIGSTSFSILVKESTQEESLVSQLLEYTKLQHRPYIEDNLSNDGIAASNNVVFTSENLENTDGSNDSLVISSDLIPLDPDDSLYKDLLQHSNSKSLIPEDSH